MWPYDARRVMEALGQPIDMINSPFAFPRLPPRANIPSGLSSAGKVKDQIVQNSGTLMGRLSDHHAMFQRYAAGLFNMAPNAFMPGHPMHSRMQAVDMLGEENERLRRENLALRSNIDKEKKK